MLDGQLGIITASSPFYHEFKTRAEDTVGKKIYDLGNGQWNIPKLRELLEDILLLNRIFDDYVVEHDHPGTGHQRILLNARSIYDDTRASRYILLAIELDG